MEDPYADTISVTLKWGKQVFKDVLIPTSGGFELFQAQIYSLTSVIPERQKLLFKGKQLKEIDPTVIKTGVTLLLIGSSDEKKAESQSGDAAKSETDEQQQQVTPHKRDDTNMCDLEINYYRSLTEEHELFSFSSDSSSDSSVSVDHNTNICDCDFTEVNYYSSVTEDSSSSDSSSDSSVSVDHNSHLPVILQNLGNTCYLNSTIQFLRTIPELREILAIYNGGMTNAADPHSLHAISMTLALKDLFKTLDQMPSDKIYSPIYLLDCLLMAAPSFAQRDKNGSLQQQDADECLSVILRQIQSKLPPLRDDTKKHSNFVDQYLTGKFVVESKCKESDEPSTTTEENFTKLSCFISQEVKFMVSGLRLSLNEELSKFNQTLQRDAKYNRNYKISRLPAYLTIHFMRFFYKEKVNMNTKILREVKFPLMFDAYEFCTDELKKNLLDMRERFRLDEENIEEKRSNSNYYKTGPCKSITELIHPFSFEDDSGSNNSGYYDLRAIITHKGRTSQAGHYVCWVRLHDGWVKIDDDIRIRDVPEEDILHLAGGSDIHTAYMLLYGPRILRRRANEPDKPETSQV